MYEEGTIIKFTPFYFKNGNTAKDKYFVVLKCFKGGGSILASLPTSVDSIPEKDVIKDGCIELPAINLNCFVISEDTEITTSGKRFDVPTHIYGHQLDSYELELLNDIYKIEDVDYEIWGKMREDIFQELLNCLKTSASVKRKFKRLLADQ